MDQNSIYKISILYREYELSESINKTIRSIENMLGNASDNIAKLASRIQFMSEDAAKKERKI